MRTADVREAWREHCANAERPGALKPAPALAVAPLPKRTPLRLAINIMPAFEESFFTFADGEIINGRFAVVMRVTGPQPEYELIDNDDNAAECVLRIEPPTSTNQVLQAIARSRKCEML